MRIKDIIYTALAFWSLIIQFGCEEDSLPTINTIEPHDISVYWGHAYTGGSIISDGGAPITVRGVCWNTNPDPKITSNITNDGIGIGSFESKITGITAGSTYYVKAYATNKVGTAYGNETSFTTASLPTVTTSVTSFTSSTATCVGNVLADGGSRILATGICIGTSPNPTFGSYNTYTTDLMGVPGIFTISAKNLAALTTYYVRAFAENEVGFAYGNEIIFTTLEPELPILTIRLNYVNSSSANVRIDIISNGGVSIIQRGVCWNTSPNPSILNSTITGTNSNMKITGLTNGITYYTKAFATNSAGTAYSNEVIFTTSLGIGDNYNGGIVAYVLQPGEYGYRDGETHGLIAAPSDQGNAPWGCYGVSIPGAQGSYVGTGAQNTKNIMAGCSEAGIAARICGDLVLNGFDDWYLPSKDEIRKLFLNALALNINSYTKIYWSSTEISANLAWTEGLVMVGEENVHKGSALSVRAIRSF